MVIIKLKNSIEFEKLKYTIRFVMLIKPEDTNFFFFGNLENVLDENVVPRAIVMISQIKKCCDIK